MSSFLLITLLAFSKQDRKDPRQPTAPSGTFRREGEVLKKVKMRERLSLMVLAFANGKSAAAQV